MRSRRDPRTAGRTRSATRATRPAGWARWSARPARRCPRADRQAQRSRRADRRRRPDAAPPAPGGAFMQPILLRTDDPWATCRPRCRGVRPGLDDHALQGHGRRHRARQSRHGQPGAVAVHLFARRRARIRPGRRRLPRPDAGPQPRQRRRSRPATARRFRSWSTAAPAAPAAARRWAASAASSTTCSAPRSSRPRR